MSTSTSTTNRWWWNRVSSTSAPGRGSSSYFASHLWNRILRFLKRPKRWLAYYSSTRSIHKTKIRNFKRVRYCILNLVIINYNDFSRRNAIIRIIIYRTLNDAGGPHILHSTMYSFFEVRRKHTKRTFTHFFSLKITNIKVNNEGAE